MQDYDLVWDNHPGSQMGPTDALSRHDEVDTSLDNTTVTMLSTVSNVLICALDVQLAERIADFTVTDPLVRDAVDAMSKQTSLFPRMSCDDWTFMRVPCTLRDASTSWNQLTRIWYAPCTAPQWGVMVDISTPLTWFNATIGGPD